MYNLIFLLLRRSRRRSKRLESEDSLGGTTGSSIGGRKRSSRFRVAFLKGEKGVSLQFGKFVALISVSGRNILSKNKCGE